MGIFDNFKKTPDKGDIRDKNPDPNVQKPVKGEYERDDFELSVPAKRSGIENVEEGLNLPQKDSYVQSTETPGVPNKSTIRRQEAGIPLSDQGGIETQNPNVREVRGGERIDNEDYDIRFPNQTPIVSQNANISLADQEGVEIQIPDVGLVDQQGIDPQNPNVDQVSDEELIQKQDFDIEIPNRTGIIQTPEYEDRPNQGGVDSQKPNIGLSDQRGIDPQDPNVPLSDRQSIEPQSPGVDPNVNRTPIEPQSDRLTDQIDRTPVERQNYGLPLANQSGVEPQDPNISETIRDNYEQLELRNEFPNRTPIENQEPNLSLSEQEGVESQNYGLSLSNQTGNIEGQELGALPNKENIEPQQPNLPLSNQEGIESQEPEVGFSDQGETGTQEYDIPFPNQQPIQNQNFGLRESSQEGVEPQSPNLEETNRQPPNTTDTPGLPEEVRLGENNFDSFPPEVNLENLNRNARDQEFDKFDLGSYSDLPYVQTRPDSSRAEIFLGNRVVPGRGLADDQFSLARFLASPQGILFNAKESTLQVQNSRRLTRVYNPTAIQTSASSPLLSDTRHLEAGSGFLGSLLQRADGFTDFISGETNFPTSSDYSEEIQALTDGEGYLRNQTPTFDQEGVQQAAYRQAARINLAEQLFDTNPDHYTLLPNGPNDLRKDQQAILDGERDQFIGMVAFEGEEVQGVDLDGVPFTRNVQKFDTYTPLYTYSDRLEEFGENESPLQDIIEDKATQIEPERFNPYPEPIRGEDPPEEESTAYEPEEGYYVIYRREGDTSYGFPRYDGSDKNQDLVNLTPIEEYETANGEIDDPETLTTEDGEEYRDLIPFRFYDLINKRRIVFRAYVEGISVSNNPNWSSNRYAGRPEQYHIYGGNDRSLSFSFKTYPESQEEFEVMWNKINYLNGLVYPSNIQTLRGGGAYMLAPFLRLTIGNLFNKWPGFIQSLDFSVPDDNSWSLKSGEQLPKNIDVSCTYTLIEREFPNTGDKLFDASFIDD